MLHGQADSEARNPSSSTPELERSVSFRYFAPPSERANDDEEPPAKGAVGLRCKSPPRLEKSISQRESDDTSATTDSANKEESNNEMDFNLSNLFSNNEFDFSQPPDTMAMRIDIENQDKTQEPLQQNVEDTKEEEPVSIVQYKRRRPSRTRVQTSNSVGRNTTSSPKGWREFTDTLLMEWTTVNPAELPLASPTH